MAEIVKPKVQPLFRPETLQPLEDVMDTDWSSTCTEDIVEFAGRSCYQSFHKPNPYTARNSDYIAHIIEQGHESVLEHATVGFYITGVTRTFTHELVRHRHLSFSQLSQRFVNEEDAAIVIPPAIEALYSPEDKEYKDVVKNADKALKRYKRLVESLQEKGLPRKQAREAARTVLPNSIETRIVVSGNLRAWRDFLKKRLDPAADAEIRIVAQAILAELQKVAPSVFADFE